MAGWLGTDEWQRTHHILTSSPLFRRTRIQTEKRKDCLTEEILRGFRKNATKGIARAGFARLGVKERRGVGLSFTIPCNILGFAFCSVLFACSRGCM